MRTLCLLIGLTFLSVGCGFSVGKGIPGSGVPATEQRDVGDFQRVDFSGAGTISVVASGPPSCELECDDNLLEFLETDVIDGTLIIRPSESISPKSGLKVRLTCDGLEALTISGAADLEVQDVDAQAFRLRVEGAADGRLVGRASELDISLSGAGDIDALSLEAENARVQVSGAGNVAVQANETVDVKISGAGQVVYRGSATLSKSISGVGSVRKLSDETL